MKIFLENLYHSDCYFLPIRDNQQVLVGVELITISPVKMAPCVSRRVGL